MIRILANDGMSKSAAAELEKLGFSVDLNHYEGDALNDMIKKVDVVIIRSATKIREALINEALETGQLKLIIRAGVGIDNIDHKYAEEKGIKVRNTPTASSASVAELAIGHMFALARHIHIANFTMRNGEWNKKAYKGTEIAGKTLGLIGFGRIAQEVAVRAKALGMTVLYYKRSGAVEGVTDYKYADMDTLLKESDYLSLHVPFSKGQKPLIGKEEMEMMKDSAIIINTARGGAVDEEVLLEMLDNGKIAAAALDVFAEEPVKNEKIYTHPKISLTPHIGASTSEAQERIGEEIVSIVSEMFN